MATRAMKGRPISIVRLTLALLSVAAATYLFAEILAVNASTVGFSFLIIVLAIATLGGFAEASVVSVAAMLSYNFFFMPPIGRFTIADPQNLVALFTFLLTALVASHLSGRAQNEAAESKRRQQETEQLYALSRAILLADPSQSMGSHAAQQIAQIFDAPATTIFDGKSGMTFSGGGEELAGIEAGLKQVVLQGNPVHDGDLNIWPISLGGQPIGALAAKGIRVSDGAFQALLNLVAISLERVRTENAAKKAEMARHSEEFKSTLLDAIAHEFKTPLTSIKAAASSLLEQGERFSPGQRELASIIDEESDRLSRLVTEAVKMSQIDAGNLKLERTAVSVDDLVESAVSHFNGRGEERIQRKAPGADSPRVFVDSEIVGLALRQLIDNALKYSTPPSPVTIAVEADRERVHIRIADQGPGIPERDRERIFEKFYRSSNTRQKQPGTGLGLHIAREIAKTHGGALWVEKGRDSGAEFRLELPCLPETGA
ncbi:MAG: ATP-binding protein [Bryobacteraceae bacterium]